MQACGVLLRVRSPTWRDTGITVHFSSKLLWGTGQEGSKISELNIAHVNGRRVQRILNCKVRIILGKSRFRLTPIQVRSLSCLTAQISHV